MQGVHPLLRLIARVLGAPLCFCLLLPSNFAYAQKTQVRERVLDFAYTPLKATLESIPEYHELLNSPSLPNLPHVDENDGILDKDPFFARSQSWLPTQAKAKPQNEITYTKEHDGHLNLNLPGNLGTLQLKQALSPQLNTDEFIILSVDEGSSLFEEKSPEGSAQGIFFIDTQELILASQAKSPVYIYHLPLGGEGWKGDLNAEQLQADSFFIQATTDDFIQLIDENDLRDIRDHSRLNALFGAYLAAEAYGKDSLSNQNLLLLPAPGSTMAFGLVFTGLNLDDEKSTPSKSALYFKSVETIFSQLSEFLLPSAHAMASPDAMVELLSKMEHFLALMGGAFALSLGAKYAIKGLREKIERNRMLKESSSIENPESGKIPKTVWGLAWQDFKQRYVFPTKDLVRQVTPEPIKDAWRAFVEANDVLAHGLYANFQIPTVLFPDVLEFLQDRFLPSLSASDNTHLRKIQNWTTYYVRKMNLGGKVNARTLALAGVLMGVVATASMYAQLMWVVPAICGGISPFLWEAAQQRIDERFSGSSEATINYIINNTFRSFYGWTMGGPAGFFMETRSQLEVFLKKEIETYMKKEGKNPHAPENQAEFEAIVTSKVDEMLALLGLPRDSEFLFDLRTIERAVQRKLGYNGDRTREIKDPGRRYFIGEERPGLIIGSITRAISIAERQLKKADSTETTRQDALKILKDVKLNLNLINKNSILSPIQQSKLRNTLKLLLTSLSYTGPPDLALHEQTPLAWVQRYGRPAAEEAAYIYRKAFLSFAYSNPDLYEISAATREKYGAQAREYANRIKSEQKLSDVEAERTFESTLFKAKADDITQIEIEKTKLLNEDSLAVKQREKALLNTRLEVAKLQTQREQQGVSAKVNHREFSERYAVQYAAQVGIRIMPSEEVNEQEIEDLYTSIHSKAKELTKDELLKTKGLKGYLKSLLSSEEKQAFLAQRYARNFIQLYKEATVDTNQVRPHSPAQPGITQKIRQTSLLKRSPVLTGFVRFFDSFFGTEVGYRPGRKARFYRNWPNFLGGYDLTSSLERTAKFFPSVVGFRWPYYLMWGMIFPLETYILLGALNFLMMAPAQWLKRLSSQNGLQPTGNATSAIAYSSIYSWTSFLGNIPIMLLSPGDSPDASSTVTTEDTPQTAPNDLSGSNHCGSQLDGSS